MTELRITFRHVFGFLGIVVSAILLSSLAWCAYKAITVGPKQLHFAVGLIGCVFLIVASTTIIVVSAYLIDTGWKKNPGFTVWKAKPKLPKAVARKGDY
jgi:hypothetical protein